MSRAPTAATKPATPSWFLTGDDFPRQQIVLVTVDPQTDPLGVPARWYERRRFQGSKWVKLATWVDPVTLSPLEPSPTHWRPDPASALLEIPIPVAVA